jgi:hypothetical protein
MAGRIAACVGDHFGTAPESVDNGIYPPQVTQMNLGGRYNFTAYGRKSSLRVQIQNILATNEWTSQYTPGFFQWPAPRTVLPTSPQTFSDIEIV